MRHAKGSIEKGPGSRVQEISRTERTHAQARSLARRGCRCDTGSYAFTMMEGAMLLMLP